MWTGRCFWLLLLLLVREEGTNERTEYALFYLNWVGMTEGSKEGNGPGGFVLMGLGRLVCGRGGKEAEGREWNGSG